MRSAPVIERTGGRWDAKSLLRHLACILALMWMPIINGQPFVFADTTSYVRAADLAVFLGSGERIVTAWTDRYRVDLQSRTKTSPTQTTAAPAGNDVRSGNIMSGRSPYFGALLYVTYVASNFWLFVVAQAVVCYALILLAMRRVGLSRPREIVLTVMCLSFGTAIAYYNGLLLADALAAFGILAFMILATGGGHLSRREQTFLFVVILASALSHLTHIVMLMGMMAALFALRRIRIAVPSQGALMLAGIALLLSIFSLYVTAFMITKVFGKPPQLVPLMTARFIGDGPGNDFVQHGCGGREFAVCRQRIPPKLSSVNFLWAESGPNAVFLTASPADRARMAAEDSRFALAVWQAYPVRQTLAIVTNSVDQMLTFGAEGLNQGCFDLPNCWTSLPAAFREGLRGSLSGRMLWPAHFMTILIYSVTGLASVFIVLRAPVVWRTSPEDGHVLISWLVFFLVAMAICDVLGGAISEPQYRYQGRLIWIVPFLAILTAFVDRRPRRLAQR